MAREAYEAKNGEVHEMKRSEFHSRLCCLGCGGFGIATKWLPGVGPVCPECFNHFDFNGRATPAVPEYGRGPEAQLALFEKTGVPSDLLGQIENPGGSKHKTQTALFES